MAANHRAYRRITSGLHRYQHLHAEAWQKAFEKFGKSIDLKKIRDQIGKGGNELLPTFLSDKEISEFGDLLKSYRGQLFRKQFRDKVEPFPRIRELFKQVKKMDKKIAIGSSAKKPDLKYCLDLIRVEDLVDFTTCSDDADRAKPHPDIFDVILKKFDIKSSEALVVGDSPYDAEAAGRAGIASIGVLCGGFDRQLLVDAGMSEIYDGPVDLLTNLGRSAIHL